MDMDKDRPQNRPQTQSEENLARTRDRAKFQLIMQAPTMV